LGTPEDEFSFLASSVERAVEVQEKTAKELLEVTPGRGRVLATRLIAHYRQLLKLVAERRQTFAAFPDEEALRQGSINEMRARLEYARGDLQRCLAWLDAVSESVLDVGTRYLMEFFASRLVSPDSEVTVVTKADGSYSTSVRDLLDKTVGHGGDEEEGIAIVVFIPRRERESGLLHPLIVHELGHSASRYHGLAQRILDEGKAQLEESHAAISHSIASNMEVNESIRKGICTFLRRKEAIDPSDAGGLTEAAGEFLWAITKACIEEAVCDAFAIELLGPTYLYAFAAIVGTSDLDDFDSLHPSARQRIRLMLEQLDERGWSEVLSTHTPQIDTWFREKAAEDGPPLESAPAFSSEAVATFAGRVREVVKKHVGDLAFSPNEFDSQTQEAITELLSVGVPPAQLQNLAAKEEKLTSIKRPQIILGSWLFALGREGGALPAIAKAPALPELSRLLPKALELSALERAWEEAE
jgi:hypothetical protein